MPPDPPHAPPVQALSFEAAALHAVPRAAIAGAVARTLLLVIDLQVDFAAPHGTMGRLGLDLSDVEAAIPRIAALAAAARLAGVAVCFSRVVTRPETDGRALRRLYRLTGRDPDGLAICRAGTEGAGYWGLRPEAGDLEISKPLYSCFAGSGLAPMLAARGIDTLVVAGLTTECCVDSTVRDAFHRDLGVFVVADACAAYDRAEHAAALRVLGSSFAVLVSSGTMIAGWGR